MEDSFGVEDRVASKSEAPMLMYIAGLVDALEEEVEVEEEKVEDDDDDDDDDDTEVELVERGLKGEEGDVGSSATRWSI